MRIPREIADKVEIYQAGQKAFAEVVKWLNENTESDAVNINDLFIVEKPTGRKQIEDGEYCEQHSYGYCEDSFYGNYYHAIEGDTQYLGYSYDC